MKKVLLLGLLGGMIWGGVLENTYSKEEFEAIDNRSGEEIAKDYVNQTLKILPSKIDNIETLTNVTSVNTKIYYLRELNSNKDKRLKFLLSTEEKKKTLIQELFKNMSKELCNDKMSRAYIYKKNIGYQQDYYEANTKEYIGSYSIDKSDCIKLEQEEKSKEKYGSVQKSVSASSSS